MSAATLACPYCNVAVSFSAGQSVAQCPSCRALLTNFTQTPGTQQTATTSSATNLSLPTSTGILVRCVGCGSLLSPPASAPTFQCGTCFTLMDQPVAPSLSASPLVSLTSSVSASPFTSTSNSPLSSAPTSSTNSPASHTTTISSLPSSSLPSQSPTPLSSASASAFSTPTQTPSLTLTSLSSAASPVPSSSSSSSSPSVSSGSKKKRKDPQAPKRSSNAYMVFCQEQRNALKEAEPTLAFGKLGKRLGEMWRNMTAEQKQPYEDKAGRDRGRYKQEMTRYQTEQMRHQMESHRLASVQQQQQRQQQQLIAAAQQHDLETRKRARIDVPLTWPVAATQQPMMMMGQMQPTALQSNMLSAGNMNPLLSSQPFFSQLDPRFSGGLYQTMPSAPYPSTTHLSGGLSLPSFMPSGQLTLSNTHFTSNPLNLSTTSSALFSSVGSPLTSLATFSTSSPNPRR